VNNRGLISLPIYPLWFSEWEPSTNRVTYRLYPPPGEDHITLIEHIPDSASSHLTLSARIG